jgi:hypothetical protein
MIVSSTGYSTTVLIVLLEDTSYQSYTMAKLEDISKKGSHGFFTKT